MLWVLTALIVIAIFLLCIVISTLVEMEKRLSAITIRLSEELNRRIL